MTTASRPAPTLARSYDSLVRAGFDGIDVFDDAAHGGAWPNWLRAVRGLLGRRPAADALLVCQDDVVFCRGLREYLKRTLWPAADVALCSPYCPGPQRAAAAGWHAIDRGWYLAGALCWAIPRAAAEAIVAELGHVRARRQIDARVGLWARQAGRSVWYHTPSLAQHIGSGNSALGDRSAGPLRAAADFIGEDARP